MPDDGIEKLQLRVVIKDIRKLILIAIYFSILMIESTWQSLNFISQRQAHLANQDTQF